MTELVIDSRRRRDICMTGFCLLLVSACEAKQMRVFLDISLVSYLDRPIYDVKMNETYFMGAVARAFYGSNSIMSMQPITLGPQAVSWKLAGPQGMPRNGELVHAKNVPILNEIPDGIKWLALHIYDNDTVEIKVSEGTAEELETERGLKIIEEWELHNGR